METGEMVVAVTAACCAEIMQAALVLVEVASRAQFTIGDMALEIEPLRPVGGYSVEQASKTWGRRSQQ